jgi:tetratricopeptide (TPR) repeat protein
LNNTAWDKFDQGDYQKALDQFIEAAELRKNALESQETVRTKETYRIARWSIAYTLRYMRKYDEAYTIQKELLAEGESKPNREELAILADKLGYKSEAEDHEKVIKNLESK